MVARADMAGQRFGRLVAVSYVRSDANGNAFWLCQCDCGGEKEVRAVSLKRATKSCGCITREIAAAKGRAAAIHGLSRTLEYESWKAAKRRCFVRDDEHYPDYGARGITMCTRWADDFTAFLADMGPRPSREYSLDRIDNDGGYEPSNCRWATRSEQQRNKRPYSEWRTSRCQSL